MTLFYERLHVSHIKTVQLAKWNSAITFDCLYLCLSRILKKRARRLWGGRRLWGHLSSWISIVVLVLIPQSKLLWECLLDHLVSHLLTHTLGEDSRAERVNGRPFINLHFGIHSPY